MLTLGVYWVHFYLISWSLISGAYHRNLPAITFPAVHFLYFFPLLIYIFFLLNQKQIYWRQNMQRLHQTLASFSDHLVHTPSSDPLGNLQLVYFNCSAMKGKEFQASDECFNETWPVFHCIISCVPLTCDKSINTICFFLCFFYYKQWHKGLQRYP